MKRLSQKVQLCNNGISRLTHFLVVSHHHRRVVVVVLEATVGPALQQQSHRVHLTSATGAMQGCIPTV